MAMVNTVGCVAGAIRQCEVVLVIRRWFCALVLVCSSYLLHAAPMPTLDVVTEDLPPYQVVINGKLSGGTAYLQVKAMLDRAGFPYKIRVLPWPRALSIAEKAPNTLIFSIARTAERESQFQWLGKLAPMQYQFYAAKRSPALLINKPTDALQYTAVAVRGSAEAQRLLSLGFVEGKNLTLITDYLAVWGMVHHQRADLTYANPPAASFIARGKMQLTDFVAVSAVEYGQPLYVAASLDTPAEVVQALRQALAAP